MIPLIRKAAQLVFDPGFRKPEFAVDGGCGNPGHSGYFFVCHAAKVVEFDYLALAGIQFREALKRAIEIENVDGGSTRRGVSFIERNFFKLPASFVAIFGPGMIDKNVAHCACGHRKEMRPIIPGNVHLNELQIRLMDKSRVLERMTFALVLHFAPRQLVQLAVNERQQFVQCLGIAGAPLNEQTGYCLALWLFTSGHFALREEVQFKTTAMNGEEAASETAFIGRGTRNLCPSPETA